MYQPPIPPDQNLYPAQGGPVPGQPVTPVVQPNQPIYQPPIVNQQQPVVVYQQPPKLKTTPVSLVCPHCHNQITTLVETHFNCLNCCLCCYCLLLWLIVELANDKDLNCTDATHKCPSCGSVIGVYTAC